MTTRHSFAALAFAILAFGSGCGCHPVQRFRAAFPCAPCAVHRPIVHHRAPLVTPSVPLVGAPCHGCGAPGAPVGYAPGAGELLPATGPAFGAPGYGAPGYGVPTIGPAYPITPGPMVIPGSELPAPMVAPKGKDGQ